MGDAGSAVKFDARHEIAFQGYKDHNGSHQKDSQLVLLEILRESHPDYHVTCTTPTKCDLFGYATAGHATASLECEDTLDSMIYYNEPGPRMEKKPGVLKDQIRFGRWRYTWLQSTYLIYEAQITSYGRPNKLNYVLSPRSSVSPSTNPGHHSSTDSLLLAVGAWSTDLHEEIYVFDEGRWSKSRALWSSVQNCTWDDVILDANLKANLIDDVVSFFNNQQLYTALAVPWKRGLILHGVPGNGKTISIKAFINLLAQREEPVPSLYVKSFDACQGAKYAIRAIFEHARVMAPCLLIFEDLDSLVTDKTRSYFLNEVDGLDSNNGILMIGSTNHLDKLDPAISKRPSRFDRKYEFRVPGREEREDYCRFWRRKLLGNSMVVFEEELCGVVAEWTEGFSFAYLKELFVSALLTIAGGGTGDEELGVLEKDGQLKEDTSGNTSSDEAVVVEKREATGSDGSEKSGSTEAKLAEDTVEKEKGAVAMKIPIHLQDNVLLKVIRSEIRTLLNEMDNTKDKVGKISGTGLPGRDSQLGARYFGGGMMRNVVAAHPFFVG